MFRRDFMPRPNNAALQKRESRFHGVCVYVAMRVFPRVIDGLVQALLHFVECPRIDSGFIGHNHFHVRADISIDNFANRCGPCILSADQPQISVALTNPDNYLLDALWPPAASLLADVCLINLNCTTEFLRRYFQHRGTNTM